MELSEDILKYDASLGDAMMKYGMSNETGKMLAKELLAREMQARELLAREMGSHAESQDRRKRSKSRSTRYNNNDSFCGNSVAMSLDGSLISKRRWEAANETDNSQHESASLPAEFLYFKFEQMVARWAHMRMPSVMSLGRYNPPRRGSFRLTKTRLPRTITTIANPLPLQTKNIEAERNKTALEKLDSKQNEDNPRFMQSTNKSATRQGRSSTSEKKLTSQRAKDNPNNQKGLNMSPANSGKKSSPSPNSGKTQRKSPSSSSPGQERGQVGKGSPSSPAPSQNRDKRQTPTKSLAAAPCKRSSPLQMTESQKRKQLPPKPRSPKVKTGEVSSHRERRSPVETTESPDAQHYQRRDSPVSSSRRSQQVRSQSPGQNRQSMSSNMRSASSPRPGQQAPPIRNMSSSQSPPTTEQPKPTTRRKMSRLPPIPTFRNTSHVSTGQQKDAKHTDDTAQNHCNEVREQGNRIITRSTHPSEICASPQYTSASVPVPQGPLSQKKRATLTCNDPAAPRRMTSLPSTKSSPNSPMSPGKKGRQTIDTDFGNTLNQQDRNKAHEFATNGEHYEDEPQRRTQKTEGQGKAAPRSQRSPQPKRYRRMHIFSATVIQSGRRMLLIWRDYRRLRRAVITLQTHFRRRTKMKTYKKILRGSRLQNFSSVIMQRNFRMAIFRSSFLHLKQETVVAQSAIRMFLCKLTYAQLRLAAKTKKRLDTRSSPSKSAQLTLRDGRLRTYSALLIQSLVRMRWVRSAYVEIQASAKKIQGWLRNALKTINRQKRASVVLQSWVRMISYRECYLDLQANVALLQAYIRMLCIRRKFKQWRLQRSALILQNLYRKSTCQSAYEQLRTATIVLQFWFRSWLARTRFLRFQIAAISVQCHIRKRIAMKYIHKVSAVVLLQRKFRSFVERSIFLAHRALVCMIQSAVRGDRERKRYLSLRSATLSMQKTRRNNCRRAIAWRPVVKVENTKMKRTKMNSSSKGPISIDTRDKPRHQQYGDVLTAALAFVSSPNMATPRGQPKVHESSGDFYQRISRSSTPQKSSPSMTARGVSTRPNRSTSFRPPTVPGNIPNPGVVWQRPHKSATASPYQGSLSSFFPFQEQNLYGSSRVYPVYDNLATYGGGTSWAGLQEPGGNYLSRRAPPFPTSPQSPPGRLAQDISTQSPLYDSSLQVPNLQYTSPYSNPSTPRDDIEYQNSQPYNNDRTLPSAQSSKSTPGDIGPGSADLMNKMSPSGYSPGQPLYFISQSPGTGYNDSSKIYALYPISNDKGRNIEGSPENQVPLAQASQQGYDPTNTDLVAESVREIPTERNGLKGAIVEGLKRERTNRRTPTSTSPDPRPFRRRCPPSGPPIARVNGSGAEEKQHEFLAASVVVPSKTDSDEDIERAIASYSDSLKKAIKKTSDKDPIIIPALKKEDDSTDRAISEKLAAIKKRSKTRIIQQLSKRTSRRKPPSKNSELEEDKEQPKGKQEFFDVAEVWAKQTIQRRKMSIFTSGLDTEASTQIQSIWRLHRAEVMLAMKMLQTSNVSCDFSPDIVENDRILRQRAYVLALDGASGQVGYHQGDGKVFQKGTLVVVQWEGIVPLDFSQMVLQAQGTCCTVSVQCSAVKSILLDSWSQQKCKRLLAKAAIHKECKNHRQKLRRFSIFGKSLTRRRADWSTRFERWKHPQNRRSQLEPVEDNAKAFYHASATVIQRTYRKSQQSHQQRSTGDSASLGVPHAFHQRMQRQSAVLIQSWYRMCVCRSMYQGLRRIQSRIALVDRDGSPIKFHRFFEKRTCETIIEEGFECTEPPPSIDGVLQEHVDY